jgi:hypothetical protein
MSGRVLHSIRGGFMGIFGKTKMAIAAIALMAAGSSVQAQSGGILFTGNTYGCFYTGSSCGAGFSALTSAGGLTFKGGSFQALTGSDGYTGVDNLGSMSVQHPPNYVYTGLKFDLKVMFTSPPGVVGDNVFEGILRGSVTSTGTGVTIDFQRGDPVNCGLTLRTACVNSVNTFAFGDGYSLDMRVFDLANINEATGESMITGEIQATTPEPATLFLMGSGLLALIPAVRRRRVKA